MRSHWSWPQKTVAWHKGRVVQVTGSLIHARNWKLPVSYEGNQSDCILLATNGDVQGLQCAHNLHMYCTKVDWGNRKMVGDPPCPIKYHYIIFSAGLGISRPMWHVSCIKYITNTLFENFSEFLLKNMTYDDSKKLEASKTFENFKN